MSKPKTTNKEKKRLVLLDTHAILHRAYHALPDFASSGGEPTGALYGLVAMLIKIITELKPYDIVACFDLPKPTLRHEVYEAYKAGRAKTDDDLVAQIERARDVLSALSIPIYEHEGFEADDILGTIVEKLKKTKDVEIVIASGDMDTLQLVSGARVQVYTLRKGMHDTILYGEKAVQERFGFGPTLLPDYKGLRGDPSDNIIGVKGIGEKTATALITTFGGIKEMYATLKKKPELFEKAGITPRIQKLLLENEDEAEFSQMLATIRRDAPIDFIFAKKSWRERVSHEKVKVLFSELGFRTLATRFAGMFPELSAEEKGASIKKDKSAEDPQLMDESAILLWLLDSDTTNPSPEDVFEYTHTDSLKDAHEKLLKKVAQEKLLSLFEDIERPLIPVLRTMEARGILLDTKYLGELTKTYRAELLRQEKKIYEYAGTTFNINSPRQLGDVLFSALGLKPKNQKKTAGGQLSTRESELVKLKDAHPIIAEILEYRELQKLLSTYLEPLPSLADKHYRLHTHFIQTGSTTGRMASQNPNLQNIPIRTERGAKIRNAFIASPGTTLASLDYSQIELRIAAILSGDEKLIDTFVRGEDVHTRVASEVFGVAEKSVTPDMRRRAKVINFGILYGMGVNALSATAGFSRSEAQEFLAGYMKAFPGLAAYIIKTKGDARKKGYTETLFGRRRQLSGISSRVPYIRAEAERQAINAPIQGTQADIVKKAMVEVFALLQKEYSSDAYLLLQIHDEIVLEIQKEKMYEVVEKTRAIMEGVLPKNVRGSVPVVVDASVGPSWGEMKKISRDKN